MGYAITREQMKEIVGKYVGDAPFIADACVDELAAKIRELDPCYGKARPGEPLFVLRAQDAVAADAVGHWIGAAVAAGMDPDGDKAEWTRLHVARMRAWGAANGTKVPD